MMENSILERRAGMRKAMTLIELIISVALIGIIALGILPTIPFQYAVLNKTKDITVNSFDSQSEIENEIMQKRLELRDTSKSIDSFSNTKNFKIFGVNIKAYDLEISSTKFGNKTTYVFLSKQLAEKENYGKLEAKNVKIEVVGGTNNDFANLASGTPSLKGYVDKIEDKTWYTNVYKWYVSDIGISEPKFPDDYKQISQYDIPPSQINVSNDKLNKYANRFIRFSVIPVDRHGLRGSEIYSSNTVFIIGKEWRTGTVAWADKDLDTNFDEAKGDTKIKKEYLLEPLDTQNPLRDFTNPEKSIDVKDSSLMIPMRIDTGVFGITDINLAYGNTIDWKADESIFLSTSINSRAESDISLLSRKGNIILSRYIKLKSDGTSYYGADGRPIYINEGSNIKTDGKVNLIGEGAGNIILQPYSKVDSKGDISVRANGKVLLNEASVESKNSINIDTTKNLGILSNRDIQAKKAKIKLDNVLLNNKKVNLLSNNKIYLIESAVEGNKDKKDILNIFSKEGNILDDSKIYNFNVFIKGHTLIQGGSWNENSTIEVANDSVVKFEKKGSGKVDNKGSLKLGDTGAVQFANSMIEDLQNKLEIKLAPSAGNEISISTNYGRNIDFAGVFNKQIEDGKWENLGTGETNLEYKIDIKDTNILSMDIHFDGINKLSFIAQKRDNKVMSKFDVSIRDKYIKDKNGNAPVEFTMKDVEI